MGIVSKFRVELVRSISTFNPLVRFEKGAKRAFPHKVGYAKKV